MKMNISNYNDCIKEIRMLLELKMIDSSDITCSLLLSSLLSSPLTTSSSLDCIVDTLELYGDILFAKNDYKRALSYYRQAMQQRKFLSSSSLSTTALSKTRMINSINTIEEAKVRYKEAQCLLSIGDNSNALKELETVPSKLRDAKFHLCLGKLYKANNRKKDALMTFKEILKLIPSCIEAIEMLVSLGCDTTEITGILDDSIRDSSNQRIYEDGWLHTYTLALSHKRNCDYEKSETHFNKLLKVYPKNLTLLGHLGKVAVDAERNDDALILYKQIRRIEPGLINGMEYYGQLLMNSMNIQELSKLGHDIMNLNQKSPVGWLLVAMYCESKGESEKAITFIEKSIQIDPQHAYSYRLKGSMLLTHGHPEQAILSFYQANALCQDTPTYTGLIHAQVAIGKHRDAMLAAKDALINLPRSSNVHEIMGNLLVRMHEHDDATSHYSKALKLNPLNINAAVSLSEVLLLQSKLHEAAQVLQNSLNRRCCYKLRTQYAKVLVAMTRYHEAIEQLHLAISLNPEDSADAAQELERLDGILNQKMEENNFEEDD